MSASLGAGSRFIRSFVTPEGVDLRLELGSGGARAGAFLIDAMIMIGVLIAFTIIIAFAFVAAKSELLAILWLVGFFLLRNGYFIMFEMGGRGATPGKRLMGLRVVARDGARLTAAAVIARNALREVEVFLPLSFLGSRAAEGTADMFLTLFSLIWSGVFLFFPLFNQDRLRVGDLVAGTWVVQTVRKTLEADLVGVTAQGRRSFTDATLGHYGVYELQTLEEVLRNGNPDSIATVAQAIRHKAGIADDGDDHGFLSDYYAALCSRLEAGLMVGRRRANKWEK